MASEGWGGLKFQVLWTSFMNDPFFQNYELNFLKIEVLKLENFIFNETDLQL